MTDGVVSPTNDKVQDVIDKQVCSAPKKITEIGAVDNWGGWYGMWHLVCFV